MAARSNSIAPKDSSNAVVRSLNAVYEVRHRIATVAAGVLVLGLGYHVVFGHNGLIVYHQKQLDSQTLDGELRNLSNENNGLKGHVDRLQSDPNAIEHEARSILHYTRPGEVVVMMSDAPANK